MKTCRFGGAGLFRLLRLAYAGATTGRRSKVGLASDDASSELRFWPAPFVLGTLLEDSILLLAALNKKMIAKMNFLGKLIPRFETPLKLKVSSSGGKALLPTYHVLVSRLLARVV